MSRRKSWNSTLAVPRLRARRPFLTYVRGLAYAPFFNLVICNRRRGAPGAAFDERTAAAVLAGVVDCSRGDMRVVEQLPGEFLDQPESDAIYPHTTPPLRTT